MTVAGEFDRVRFLVRLEVQWNWVAKARAANELNERAAGFSLSPGERIGASVDSDPSYLWEKPDSLIVTASQTRPVHLDVAGQMGYAAGEGNNRKNNCVIEKVHQIRCRRQQR